MKSSPVKIGKEIKHYKIQELIGKGGMGIVYKAFDTKLNRPVAIKILNADLTKNPNLLKRFLQEARSTAAVIHPAIAQIYEIDEVDGLTFIAMEFIEGHTVKHLITHKELDLVRSVDIALQVAEGLNKAHKSNIIHRDIKPANIIITPDGHAKLLDFGLAKLLEKPGQDLSGRANKKDSTGTEIILQTTEGTVLGTIAYMSPEQTRGQTMGPPSDIFSLGSVLYEMIAGKLPFAGESALDTMHSIVYDEVKPVTVIKKNLPPEIHRIVLRCLRKLPRERYQDSGQLAADLKNLKRDIESGVLRPLSVEHKLQGLMERIKHTITNIPFNVVIISAIAVLVFLILFFNLQWGNLLWPAIVGLIVYRYIKNRKNRMVKGFVKKISRFSEISIINLKENQINIFVDRAQAKHYVEINNIMDNINRKLYFGKPLQVSIKADLTADQLQPILMESGIVYVRDDVLKKPINP